MSALICGSVAYDTIMVFHDRFRNHILPDKVHILNVSFLVPDLRREFGGCAGNIAYSLALLGGDALPMATVGRDFDSYKRWMQECGVQQRHVSVVKESYTAQAFITTDLDDNQITAFHPGAMNFSHLNSVHDANGVSIGIVAPDGRDGMIQHAREFADADIPFIFDPSQGLPMFSGDDLKHFIDQASWVTANDYEWQLMQERTGYSTEDVLKRVRALVVTRGAHGSTIHTANGAVDIPAAPPVETLDPTGCGDAYRAGLLYGLMNDMDWESTGRVASLMGTIAIERAGTQNHRFERSELEARFRESFGYSL